MICYSVLQNLVHIIWRSWNKLTWYRAMSPNMFLVKSLKGSARPKFMWPLCRSSLYPASCTLSGYVRKPPRQIWSEWNLEKCHKFLFTDGFCPFHTVWIIARLSNWLSKWIRLLSFGIVSCVVEVYVQSEREPSSVFSALTTY